MSEEETALSKFRGMFRSRRGGASAAVVRKELEVKIRGAVDGRGRTEQFNFKCRPGTKAAVKQAAKANRQSIAEWMESAIETKLSSEAQIN